MSRETLRPFTNAELAEMGLAYRGASRVLVNMLAERLVDAEARLAAQASGEVGGTKGDADAPSPT